MGYVLLGIGVLLVVWGLWHWNADSSSQGSGRRPPPAGVLLAFALAVTLAVAGRVMLAVPLFLGAIVFWRKAQAIKSEARRSIRSGGRMGEAEALQVLGLEAGATEAQIRAAHRELIRKIHPDHGGTANLAARVNEAKEILLHRDR